MEFSKLGYYSLERFKEVEIEDVGFFFEMTSRMIEDIEIVIYVIAKSQGSRVINEETVSNALHLIGATDEERVIKFEDAPTEAFINTVNVRDFARAPLLHDEAALALLVKYVNFQLINMLNEAAEQASKESLLKIKIRHFLPWCENWPWPLNRYC